MKIPRKFTLMGLEWQVLNQAPIKDGQEQLGLTAFDRQVIYINPAMTQLGKEQTFLHELLHVIMWQMGLDKNFSYRKEEYIVNALSNGLFAALKELKLLQ